MPLDQVNSLLRASEDGRRKLFSINVSVQKSRNSQVGASESQEHPLEEEEPK
jgi:hypothetical protein